MTGHNISAKAQSSCDSWAKVVLLVLTGAVAAFQVGKIPLTLKHLQSDLGFDLVIAGWVASLFAVIGAGTAILLSFGVARFGLKRTVVLGLCTSAVASLLGSLAQDVTLLLITRVFEGLGFILTVLCLPPLITQCAPKGQTSAAMAFWAIYLPLGTCVMLMISALVLQSGSWRMVWMIAALALLVAALLISRLDLPQPTRSVPRALQLPALGRLGWIYLAALSSCFAVYAAQYYVFVSFLPKILTTSSTTSIFKMAGITGVFIALNACGNVLSGLLHKAGAESWLLISVAAVGLMVLCPMVLADGPLMEIRLGAAALLSLLSGLVPSSLFAATSRLSVTPEARAFTNACLVQASALGQLLGTPLVAFAVSRSEAWSAATPLIWTAAGLILGATLVMRALSD